MIPVRRILKDYRDAGALHTLVSVQAVVDNGVFVTKSGDLFMLLAMEGPDYECLDPEEIDRVARRFESALRLFDERFRLYQYLLKRDEPVIPAETHTHPVVAEATAQRLAFLRSRAREHFTIETYLTVVYEGWRPPTGAAAWAARLARSPRTALRNAWSADGAVRDLETGLDQARELLVNKVGGFLAQARGFMHVEALDSERGYVFLRRLLNYAPFKSDGVPLKYAEFIDFQACDSSLECHRNSLILDDHHVQVLTLKEPPARTFAHMLRGLAEIPCNCVVATEWKRESAQSVRRQVQSKRRHFHNAKASLMNYLPSRESNAPRDMLIDDGAVAVVADLGGCLEEIEVRGNSFGQFSLTVILYDPDEAAVRRAVAQCFKAFAALDGQLIDERYNRLNAWLAVLPGNPAYNLRRLWISATNYADLSFLCTIHRGRVRNDQLDAEYLAIFEGAGGVPYYFNLHCKDVAHTLVLGATGSGKSFLLNFLVTSLQKYEPATFIFDLGGGYDCLTQLFGGRAVAVGSAQRGVRINPFCLPATPDNFDFLFAFLRVLVERNGYCMDAEDERDLYEQIKNLYEIEPSQRRLFTLSNIVRRPLRRQLQKWVQGGPYAGLFDNGADDLTFSRFQVFDFEGMDQSPDQLEALLFYVLHRASAAISDAGQSSTLKVFVIDEAWRFLRHPVIRAYILQALKTWRKKGAAMLLATQSSEDLLGSDMLATVVESCPTKLFLANPGIDRNAYRQTFHLNETEADLVGRLIPKQQVLIKQPEEAKLVNLRVDPKSYWLYTNNPQDNQRRLQAFERHGFQQGLEILAKEMK